MSLAIFRVCALVVGVSLAVLGMRLVVPILAQSGAPGDWPSHNYDVRNSRFSPLDQINTSNVNGLTQQWTVQMAAADVIVQMTPVVVDGIMYFNAGSKIFAVDGATGKSLWTYNVDPAFPGSVSRGPIYADGRIYAFGEQVLYAIDAKTGQLVHSFGNRGRLLMPDEAIKFKSPDRDAAGYRMAGPPAYFNGTLYMGLGVSDRHIFGGLIAAIDGATGKIKWVFNTVPQKPADDGWEIAKDTWIGGVRSGGGSWTQPAIDAELGLLYVNAGNPSPVYEGTARHGTNLFTNSILALRLDTGKLVWHYQAIHHDIWDWDLATGPILFDVNVAGKTIKGVASAGKNCFVYMFNRETGEPLNPIVETPVATRTDVPGEELWPTQPYPYTGKGVPMTPFCATFAVVPDVEKAKRARPMYWPLSTKEFPILATGGSNYGSPAFSPRTKLLYVSGKSGASSFTVRVAGDTLKPAPMPIGFYATVGERNEESSVLRTQTVTAYNPITGELVWQDQRPGNSSGGNLATAGDLVFQGSDRGEFFALDARTGKELFKMTVPRAIRASPLTYRANGKQYVAFVASNVVHAFALK
jgi:PQQ-dependent dehydrogenase (methanol/ethanol family)